MIQVMTMHPRTEDLLSIRDGLSDARWREHIDRCGECAARLAELERTRCALRALPAIEPSVAWSQVQSKLDSLRLGAPVRSQTRKRVARTTVGLAIAASAAVAAVVITLQQTQVDSPEQQPLAAAPANTTADLTSLIERSRRLDTLLQAMPERPRIERVSMAATLDTMEERIQWLDYQLSYAAGDLDAMQSERLWQERVELMDSLVKVRYAQARTASF